MKYIFLFAALIGACTNAVAAKECDCTSYPFKPNPPCFGFCVAKLSATPNAEFENVKNIDPGVSVSIRVLSQTKNRASVDFKSIQGKQDLERATLKVMQITDRVKSDKQHQ